MTQAVTRAPLLLLVLSATVLAAGPFRAKQIAAPGLQTVRLSKKLADFCNEHLSQRLNEQGLKVISPAQIGAVLGLERQRQLLGCSESTECMTELTNAMGADALVVGSVGVFGESFQVDVKIVNSLNGSVLASHSGRVVGEEALLDELGRTAADLAAKLTVPAPQGRSLAGPLLLGALAVGCAGGGAFLGQSAQDNASVARKEALGGDATRFTTAQQAVKWQAPAADALFGAALVAGGVAVWMLLRSPSAPVVAVAPTSDGAAVVVAGRF